MLTSFFSSLSSSHTILAPSHQRLCKRVISFSVFSSLTGDFVSPIAFRPRKNLTSLKTFPDEVLDLGRSVRTLDLTHNKLVDIPVEISKLINLQRLQQNFTRFLTSIHSKFLSQLSTQHPISNKVLPPPSSPTFFFFPVSIMYIGNAWTILLLSFLLLSFSFF